MAKKIDETVGKLGEKMEYLSAEVESENKKLNGHSRTETAVSKIYLKWGPYWIGLIVDQNRRQD